MNVIVNGLAISYQRSGKGKQLLLLHGWADSQATFDAVTKRLEKHYDVIRVDLPGFGGSQDPDVAWGLDEYADFVQAFVKKVGLTPYGLVGHSNGGAIAIKAIATLRSKPEKLVLIASAGIRGREPLRKLALKMVAKTGKAVTWPLPVAARQRLRKKLYGSIGSDLLVAPHMEETFKRITGEDIQSDAMMLELPTLIVNGTEDIATPLAYAETFNHAIEGSELAVVDGASHFVHQEEPELVVERMEAFLA